MMRKTLTAGIILAVIVLAGCVKTARKTQLKNNKDATCGTINGKTLHKDSQHNCYYLNENGFKEYVENSACNCI